MNLNVVKIIIFLLGCLLCYVLFKKFLHIYVLNFLLKILCFFFFLAAPHSLRDLNTLTRDQTQAPAVKAPSLNHWTAKEFSCVGFFFFLRDVHFIVNLKYSSDRTQCLQSRLSCGLQRKL